MMIKIVNVNEFSNYLHEIKEWVQETFHGAVSVGSNRDEAA